MLLYRAVLENCKTVGEAMGLFCKRHRAIHQQSHGGGCIWQPRRCRAHPFQGDSPGRKAETAALVPAPTTSEAANHISGPLQSFPTSSPLFARFSRLSEASVEENLDDAAPGDMTFQS